MVFRSIQKLLMHDHPVIPGREARGHVGGVPCSSSESPVFCDKGSAMKTETTQESVYSIEEKMCQSIEMDLLSEDATAFQKMLFFVKRALRFLRIRMRLLNYNLDQRIKKGDKTGVKPELETFKPGDEVRVKSKEDISKTLDGWKRYKGCRFMDEMWKYCGGTHKVYKKVNFILNEKTIKMRRFNHVYLLEGLICEGTWPFKNCDRSCFYFWRAEWLEKVK
jgi:hypothetical protein